MSLVLMNVLTENILKILEVLHTFLDTCKGIFMVSSGFVSMFLKSLCPSFKQYLA